MLELNLLRPGDGVYFSTTRVWDLLVQGKRGVMKRSKNLYQFSEKLLLQGDGGGMGGAGD